MNFNNINGVWPQIKDYIDSKLGGGVNDKYKHMIYVPCLYILKISSFPSSGYAIGCYGLLYNNSIIDYISGKELSGGDNYKPLAYAYIYKNKVIISCIEATIYTSSTVGTTIQFCENYFYYNNSYSTTPPINSTYGYIVTVLKEGWYINCCGQIYDYQGNIVE